VNDMKTLWRIALIAAAAVAGPVLGHTGHGAPTGHVHGWGVEHIALLGAAVLALVHFDRK